MPDNEVFTRQIDRLKEDLRLTQSQLSLVFEIETLAGEGCELSYFHSRCLELIAKHYDFVIGQMWTTNVEEEVLSCASPWYATSGFNDFRRNSRERRLSKGIGLPGRAWGVGMAVYFEDLEKESTFTFPRFTSATGSRLRSAIAFPIRHGSTVFAVYEFFSTYIKSKHELNPTFFEKLGAILGLHLGMKQALEEFAENELKYQLILDKAYNGFITVDSVGTITTWNKRCEEIFGWSKEEVQGKLISDVIIPERFRDAHIKGMFRFLSTGETRVSNKRVQTPALHKNGTEITIEMTIFPMLVQEKKLFGAFLMDLAPQEILPAIVLS